MIVEKLSQIMLITLGYGERAFAHDRCCPVFRTHARKATEGVEADDLPRVVVRFVNSTKRFEQSKSLSPTDTELHNNAGDVDDLAVELVHPKNASHGLPIEEQPQMGRLLLLRDRRALVEIQEAVADLQLVRRRPIGNLERSGATRALFHDAKLKGYTM